MAFGNFFTWFQKNCIESCHGNFHLIFRDTDRIQAIDVCYRRIKYSCCEKPAIKIDTNLKFAEHVE